LPASTRIFETVLIDTSHTREIDRMELPSHNMLRTWTRFSSEQFVHALASELL
jgi:hypothetical protein